MTEDLTARIEDAVALLRRGRPVCVATETVFGIACDAASDDAVAAVFDLKGRDEGNPLPVLVADEDMARSIVESWPETARALARAFWPGPLTIVVEGGASLARAVTAGTGAVGLRCPDHPVALALVRAFGGPLALTSANASGDPPSATEEEARRFLEYADRPDTPVLADNRVCSGVATTVVRVGIDRPELRVLRHGGISEDDIAGALR